jgi:hypothetical protein
MPDTIGPVLLPEPPIETARLTLRFFAPADFDDLYAYQSRPDVARYLHWHARDPAQVRQALEQQCERDQPRASDASMFVKDPREDSSTG